jgi:hypothetical protein
MRAETAAEDWVAAEKVEGRAAGGGGSGSVLGC